MFVIMQCFDNLRGEELKQENTEKIALAMKHAGMAITVTSLTDFIVFIVGASSVSKQIQCNYHTERDLISN